MSSPGSWLRCCIVSLLGFLSDTLVVKQIHTQLFLSEACSRDFPMMLSVFSNLLTKESDLRVIDNLCAALCRMIMSNVEAVPLEQVKFSHT